MNQYYDAIVIGAGIVGLSIARELKLQNRDISILVIEKERQIGLHASGRNSGVLHSGLYYPSESIKGKVCSSGSKDMAEYCHEHGLPIKHTGKVIVPVRYEDDKNIDLLHNRAQKNHINTLIIDKKELRDIEPEAYSKSGRALYSPDTSVISPLSVMNQIATELNSYNVDILTSSSISKFYPDESKITINKKQVIYGKLYNAAGLYADKIAHFFSVGNEYTILPFKGTYYQLKKDCDISINKLIYPVPDLNYPFLGIHSITAIDGSVFFGPSSIVALGRENYMATNGIDPIELFSIGYHIYNQYIYSSQFRRFAHKELSQITRNKFTNSVKSLVPRINSKCLVKSKKVGIRAQLYNKVNNKLETDFIIKSNDNSVHILNAISPAFTSAFSMAKLILRDY